MESVVGLCPSREAAEKVAASLQLPQDHVGVVAPAPRIQEDAGIGKALGGVVGGSLGLAAGSTLGPAAASLLIPGVGPIVALGVGMVVLGAGGLAAGLAAGKKIESSIPLEPSHDRNDVFFYHEALRRGRAIVFALADTDAEAAAIRARMAEHGAQSLDTVREDWWHEVRGQEQASYHGDFVRDEQEYRRGFEEALAPANRGKEPEHSNGNWTPYDSGYTRGYQYLHKLEAA